MIEHNFHDAARILDVVGEEAEPAAAESGAGTCLALRLPSSHSPPPWPDTYTAHLHAMAIARKLRRRLEIDGRDYLWWVYEDLEAAGAMTLAVASADKDFLVHYAIHQPDDSRHLTVLGRELPGLPDKRPSWARVRCPVMTSGEAVKPSDVRRLVEWCLHTRRDLIQVDWMGRELPTDDPPIEGTKPAATAPSRARKKARTSPPARRSGFGPSR